MPAYRARRGNSRYLSGAAVLLRSELTRKSPMTPTSAGRAVAVCREGINSEPLRQEQRAAEPGPELVRKAGRPGSCALAGRADCDRARAVTTIPSRGDRVVSTSEP